jgi:hypothetical protein
MDMKDMARIRPRKSPYYCGDKRHRKNLSREESILSWRRKTQQKESVEKKDIHQEESVRKPVPRRIHESVRKSIPSEEKKTRLCFVPNPHSG